MGVRDGGISPVYAADDDRARRFGFRFQNPKTPQGPPAGVGCVGAKRITDARLNPRPRPDPRPALRQPQPPARRTGRLGAAAPGPHAPAHRATVAPPGRSHDREPNPVPELVWVRVGNRNEQATIGFLSPPGWVAGPSTPLSTNQPLANPSVFSPRTPPSPGSLYRLMVAKPWVTAQ
jgi:hypothetical protein